MIIATTVYPVILHHNQQTISQQHTFLTMSTDRTLMMSGGRGGGITNNVNTVIPACTLNRNPEDFTQQPLAVSML